MPAFVLETQMPDVHQNGVYLEFWFFVAPAFVLETQMPDVHQNGLACHFRARFPDRCVNRSNTKLVLLSKTVFRRVIPKWYYFPIHCLGK